MIKKVENRFVPNLIYCILIILVIFSNIFADKLERLLKLTPDIESSSSTQVHFIDVGQGDAIAIKFPNNKIMLVDSGTSEYREKLIYYLDNVVLDNSNKIDYLVLTHSDSDHSGNMKFLLDNYEIGTFYRPPLYEEYEGISPYITSEPYREILQTLESKNINVVFNSDSLYLNVGDVSIDWIAPNSIMQSVNNGSTNNFSCVLIIKENDKKIMLTGDIDSSIENYLMSEYGEEILDVDILKVAHHGSKNSTSLDFIEATSPELLVASVGENTYGHPANELLLRLLEYDEESGSDTYNNFYTTLKCGNIIITLDDLQVDTISNIDDYNFTDYYIYTIIAVIFLLYFMLLPYYFVWKRNIRFIIQNKKFKKNREKMEELNKQIKNQENDSNKR